MARTKNRVLSREEEAELERSNKKVRHTGFSSSQEGGCQLNGQPRISSPSETQSFKDKLLGEIPGAYNQAFIVDSKMDADIESDDEIEELREGFAAVRLSKEAKHRIRTVWASSLIVKVYGRSVGFNFIQSKLNALWKPMGRMDVIDLGKEFYLTRFSCKEDHDMVLRKGPWFVGEHFLSIRPWEPNFQPSSTNVSSIAVWIRLNELPIEYYELEVLTQIGNAVGKILRIDTYTANEARGRFARLCVQVDVDKPLVTTVLIGGIHQTVNYEGIHKLCFSCGRIGHRKEACPYTIRSNSQLGKDGHDKQEGSAGSTHDECDRVDPSEGVEPMPHNQKDTYGPWLVVTKKRQGNRAVRSTSNASGIGCLRVSGGNAFLSIGPKISTGTNGNRKQEEAHFVQARDQEEGPKHVDLSTERVFQAELRKIGQFSKGSSPSPAHSPSVKGKKGIARNRAPITLASEAVGLPSNQKQSVLESSTSKPSYGVNQRWDDKFQFTTSASDEVGHISRRNDHSKAGGSGDEALCEDQGRSDSVGDHIADCTNSGTVQVDQVRELRGEDDVGVQTFSNSPQEQQAFVQAGVSVSTHGGGSTRVSANQRSSIGDVMEVGMDLEG
nr:uncharacterized protein CFP56_17124 [Quercus suber]